MAVRAPRSRMRAREAARGFAERILISPAVLPLRRRRAEFCGLRPAELARVPGSESVARAAADRPGGLCGIDCRRHAIVAKAVRPAAEAPRVRGADAESEHHDVPLRAAGTAFEVGRACSRGRAERAERSAVGTRREERQGIFLERSHRRKVRPARLY